MAKAGYFLIGGQQGTGKTTEAVFTFSSGGKQGLYIGTAEDNLTTFDTLLKMPQATELGLTRPVVNTISPYYWSGDPSGKCVLLDTNGNLTRWPQKALFEGTAQQIAQLAVSCRMQNRPFPYSYVMVDEAGSMFDHVFAEIAGVPIIGLDTSEWALSKKGEADTRRAHGVSEVWVVNFTLQLRDLLMPMGVHLIYICHEREFQPADPQNNRPTARQGGPRFTNNGMMNSLIAMSSMTLMRTQEAGGLPGKPPKQGWQLMNSSTMKSKSRGIPPHMLEEMKTMSHLSQIITAAGYTI